MELGEYSAAYGCTVAPVTVASKYPHSTFNDTPTCNCVVANGFLSVIDSNLHESAPKFE